jgi:hypothetical protein
VRSQLAFRAPVRLEIYGVNSIEVVATGAQADLFRRGLVPYPRTDAGSRFVPQDRWLVVVLGEPWTRRLKRVGVDLGDYGPARPRGRRRRHGGLHRRHHRAQLNWTRPGLALPRHRAVGEWRNGGSSATRRSSCWRAATARSRAWRSPYGATLKVHVACLSLGNLNFACHKPWGELFGTRISHRERRCGVRAHDAENSRLVSTAVFASC